MQLDHDHPAVKEGKQVGKFGVIGALNTLLDFTVYNLMIILLGLSAIPANLVSTTLAMTFSFFANKSFVFGSKTKRLLTQAALFLLVTMIGLYVIQNSVLYLLLHAWTWPLETIYALLSGVGLGGLVTEAVFTANGAKVIATVLSLGWNYLLYRNIVFNNRRNKIFDAIGDWFAENRQTVVLIGIIGLTIIFRFWQLGGLPPGLHPSEAAVGLTTIAITEGEATPIHQQTHPRSGPYLFLTGLSVTVFGNTDLALRLVTALLGVAAVIMTYTMAKTWFSQRVATVAALFMATSPWVVQFNRLAEPANIILVLVPLIMWLFARALKTNQPVWLVLSGVTLGGIFYTETALYLPLLLSAAILAFAWKYYRSNLRRMLQPLMIVALSVVLTVVPIVIYFVANYAEITADIEPATRIDIADVRQATPVLMRSTLRTVTMFHFSGDNNQLYNLAGEPLVNGLVGILLVLGVALAIIRIKDLRYFVLLALVAAWLLPSIFSTDSGANAALSIGAAPAIMTLAAIGLVELFARWRGVFPRNVLALQFALTVIAFSLFSGIWYDWQRYFVAWANSPATYEVHHEAIYQAGNYVRQLETEDRVYVVADDNINQIVAYLAFDHTDYTRVEPKAADGIVLSAGEQIVVPRYIDTAGLSLPDYEPEDVYSEARPAQVLYTIYRP